MPPGTSHVEERQNHSLIDHLNAFNDGIYISEPNGICLYANDALCSILGFDYSGALFDLNILDFIAPEFKEDFRDTLNQSRNMQPETGDISILPLMKRNGQMILAEINPSFTMINDSVISITAIVRDLSARKVPLALSEKLTTYYPGLLKDLPMPASSGVQNEDELIVNKGLNKHEFQVNVVLQEIKSSVDKDLRVQSSHNLILSLTIPDPDPTRSISTDQEVFVQIIRNLLDYMIKVSGAEHIEFGYHIEKGIYPLFFVRDFSREIPHTKLNQSYENLDELSNFSSLPDPGIIQNLAHTQDLVKLLNGSIWAKSGMAENLVFYFHVGKEQIISHATIHGKESSDKEIEWDSKNILVVEDLPNNYLYIEAILRKTRANLIHATNGIDAVNVIKSGQKIDLILMDIRMPGMDGYEATRNIKFFKPNIPVIAVTAYSVHEEEEKIRKAGINGYVSKPIHSDDLISTMNEVMRNSPRRSFRLKKWAI
jgi:PAS domain S-box-containing protein